MLVNKPCTKLQTIPALPNFILIFNLEFIFPSEVFIFSSVGKSKLSTMCHVSSMRGESDEMQTVEQTHALTAVWKCGDGEGNWLAGFVFCLSHSIESTAFILSYPSYLPMGEKTKNPLGVLLLFSWYVTTVLKSLAKGVKKIKNRDWLDLFAITAVCVHCEGQLIYSASLTLSCMMRLHR